LPLVLDCEGDWFDEYRQMMVTLNPIQAGWAKLCQRFCFDTSKAIICVTDELKNYLIQAWNIPDSKLFVLPNGVDPVFLKSVSVQNARAIRDQYDIGDDLVVMFVGGFYPRHAVDQLIHSFKIVKEQMENCKLILVGDGQTRDQVFKLVKSYQIEDSVTFTGAIDYKNIPDIISLADVMVSPSLEYSLESSQELIKTSPLKLLEYMAAGKPCVATATSPQKKVVVNGENGILVSPGDVNGFAAALLYLLSEPAERERIGKNASEYVANQHSWQAYGEKLLDIYRIVQEGLNPSKPNYL
jgi:glycosyltransferase involved in cell wall biosynthesis